MKIRVGTIASVGFVVMAVCLAFGILPMNFYNASVLILYMLAGALGMWLDF